MRFSILAAAAFMAATGPVLAQPEARFETNVGNFTILLEDAKAPQTVANFIRYAKKGHFNGTQFYRIVPGFVIQAGSMGADGKWRQTMKPIGMETATGLSNTRGTIAMARDEKPLSTQAEFFINLADTNAQGLDPKPGDAPNTTGYAVFGHVTSGMDVVDAIAGTPIGGGKGPFPANYPKTQVVIKKVTIGVAPPQPVPPPAAPAAATTDQQAPAAEPQAPPATPQQ
ncbi:cyclophilin family peptidyl-prolyl cis-trans isomerase [Rhizomicrobium palustre]|uniref:Peptidyl-prolyl cis-trans isomerase n=1 Tax=Rhizomicrobium palustre TaxID=189966 RepID=A0A846MX94_9PROT|nr:peptidylprolyl isomerase [Rhizomicrobium palustre]NIK87943.1 cyclophilin family peptidyl-prolyl cis-trans isomerase [Rhizomicrobium palustre]